MAESVSPRRSPSCQSENLLYGHSGLHPQIFIAGKSDASLFSSTPYNASAYVCVACGALGYYLNARELELLRQKQAQKGKTK